MRAFSSIALLAATLCFAAAPAQADMRQIMRSGASYVRIESQEAGVLPNAHPASLTPAQVAAVLFRLQVQIKSVVHGNALAALFTETSVRSLAPAISEALGKATAREDISFAISERRSGSLGQELYVTSAKVFVRDGELNIIMGEVIRPLRSVINRRSQTSDSVLQPRSGYLSAAVMDQIEVEPGSRRQALSGNTLVENTLIRFPELTGATRKDWVVVSLTALADEKIVDEKTANPKPIELQTAPPGVELGTPANESATIEARLRRLKALREQGLISEETYREKQRELLHGL